MHRATRSLLVAALAVLAAAPALAQGTGRSMDGIGLIDYSRKPTFKVGSYAQYHVTGRSSKGHSQDYRLMVGDLRRRALLGRRLLLGRDLDRG